MKLLKEIYAYREMIFSLVRRDLKGRYKGSVLGFLWTFINPLLQLLVYTFAFSIVMKNDIEDYYLFLFVALVPWIFFSTSLVGGATCIWSQKEMVKKIYFPRQVLPISFVTSQFINMLLSFLIIFAVLLVTGKGIDLLTILVLPFVMIVEYLIALGVALISSAVTVYLRDIENILAIIAMAGQFTCPIIYSLDTVPENIITVINLNPMTPIIIAYRDILYYQQMPEFGTLVQALVFGIVVLLVGFMIFSKLEKHFAEEM